MRKNHFRIKVELINPYRFLSVANITITVQIIKTQCLLPLKAGFIPLSVSKNNYYLFYPVDSCGLNML